MKIERTRDAEAKTGVSHSGSFNKRFAAFTGELFAVSLAFLVLITAVLSIKGFDFSRHYAGGGYSRLDWNYVDWNMHYWNIWEFERVFSGDKQLFHTDSEFFPEGINTATLHGDLLVKILAGFFSHLTSPDAALLFIVFFALLGNAVGGYYLARMITGSWPAGLATGIFFCFNGPVAWAINSGNIEYGIWLWICLYIYFFLKKMDTEKTRYAVFAAFFAAASVLSNNVFLVFLVILSLLLLVTGGLNRRRIRSGLVLASFSALLLVPVTLPFIKEHLTVSGKTDSGPESSVHHELPETVTERLDYISSRNSYSLREYMPWFGNGSGLLGSGDIRNAGSFAFRLAHENDPVSAYLFNRFSPAAREIFQDPDMQRYGRDRLNDFLRRQLNAIMLQEYIYDSDRFSGIPLDERSLNLHRSNPKGEMLLKMNRRLLESTYPGELAKFEEKSSEDSYTGYAFWILLAAALLLSPRKAAPWVVIFSVFFLLSLGPCLKLAPGSAKCAITLPYTYFYKFIPIFHRVFFPHRIFGFAQLAAGIAAGIAVSAITGSTGKWWIRIPAILVLLLLLLEPLYNWPIRYMEKVRVNPFYETIAENNRDSSILEIPYNSGTIDARYLFYQTRHGKPLLNGVVPTYHQTRDASPACGSFSGNGWLERIEELQRGFLRENHLCDERTLFAGTGGAVEGEDYASSLVELAVAAKLKYVILHKKLIWERNLIVEYDEIEDIRVFLVQTMGEPVYADHELEVFKIDSAAGTPAFKAPVRYKTESAPHFVASGDFNGDSEPDLVVPNCHSGSVSVFFNLGEGRFAEAENFKVHNGPTCVFAGDVDGDKYDDILASCFVDHTIDILYGRGDGTFDSRFFKLEEGLEPHAVIAEDLDRDGNIDILVANGEGDNVQVFAGEGERGFGSARSFATGERPYSLVSTDFDGDGRRDIVTGNFESENITVMLGCDRDYFCAVRNYFAGKGSNIIDIGDIDLDGDFDIAVSNCFSNSVALLLGAGDGTFNAGVAVSCGREITGVEISEITGDSLPDLISLSGGDGAVSFFRNEGDFEFTRILKLAVGEGPCFFLWEDISGDSRPDLVVPNMGSNDMHIYIAQ